MLSTRRIELPPSFTPEEKVALEIVSRLKACGVILRGNLYEGARQVACLLKKEIGGLQVISATSSEETERQKRCEEKRIQNQQMHQNTMRLAVKAKAAAAANQAAEIERKKSMDHCFRLAASDLLDSTTLLALLELAQERATRQKVKDLDLVTVKKD